MNDVMNVWQMAVLAGRNTQDSLLLNFDGFREAGPAGGPSNRLMVPSDVDYYGPYIDYYKSWFSEIKKAVLQREACQVRRVVRSIESVLPLVLE
jgi:hypothetical protein